MRYKWIALVLACALLLCGCRQMGTDISVSDDTTKTGGTSDVVTTTTASAATTTNGTTVTRPPNYTQDGSSTKQPAKFSFASIEEYVAAVETFVDRQALYDYLVEHNLQNKAITEEELTLLLEQNFFLVPQPQDGYACSEAIFSTGGSSTFVVEQQDNKSVQLRVSLLHCQKNEQGLNEKTYEFTNARGITVTRYAFEYMWYEGDTPISVTVPYTVTMDEATIRPYEDFIKNLTFKKVDIK